jgi:hypothetical protein
MARFVDRIRTPNPKPSAGVEGLSPNEILYGFKLREGLLSPTDGRQVIDVLPSMPSSLQCHRMSQLSQSLVPRGSKSPCGSGIAAAGLLRGLTTLDLRARLPEGLIATGHLHLTSMDEGTKVASLSGIRKRSFYTR